MLSEDPGLLTLCRISTGEQHVQVEPSPEPHVFYDSIKRAMDIVIGISCLVLTSPLILLSAAAIIVAYRTNPFFVQNRVGYLGRRFLMFKLKSMHDGAEDEIPADLNKTAGPTFKADFDPRTTRIGRVLRTTSIDELPQLINVIFGQMSLVGPRPALSREVMRYTPPQLKRLSVKPGLTCIWQVSGRSNIQFKSWMLMDRAYVRKRTIWLDLYLLLLTPWSVITMRGAR